MHWLDKNNAWIRQSMPSGREEGHDDQGKRRKSMMAKNLENNRFYSC